MKPNETTGARSPGRSPLDGAALAVALNLALSFAGSGTSGGGGAARGADSAGMLDYPALKRSLKEAVARDPFDATVVTVLGGAFLFYLAEKDENPKVTSYWDALVFVSTCLSVGYHDVFARTPAGKAIAAAVMTFGPALSGALFEGPATPPADNGPTAEQAKTSAELVQLQRVVVEKLDAILLALQRPSAG